MTKFGDETGVSVLSDADEEVVPPTAMASESQKYVPVAKFLQILTELSQERQLREAAEASKLELQKSYNQLKALAREAIKKREENKQEREQAFQEKDEALKAIEELTAKLYEADELREEAVRSKDSLRSEIETAAQMLVIGIDKISGKIVNFNNFSGGGLPRSQKYTGLQAVAYGVIKRTNEIVEELLRRVDVSLKSMNEAREQMDQRNYEIALEFSQLEAAFGEVNEELSKKSYLVEMLENDVAGKNERISEIEREMLKQQTLARMEISDLRKLVNEFKEQRSLLVNQSSYVSKIHENIDTVIKIVDCNKLEQSKSVKSSFLPQVTSMEGNLCASLAGMELIYKSSKSAVEKTRDLVDQRNFEVKRLSDAGSQLVKEKEQIVKQLQLEIIDLQRIVDKQRAETSLLEQHIEAQDKALFLRKQHIEEIEEKERVSNDDVEELMMDIAAAEEEITRWKVAAQQEADAGKSVEENFVAQLSTLREELEEAKKAVAESEKKLKLKEHIADAAMVARDAAENSLRLADTRTSRIRGKVEELSHQLEQLDSRETWRYSQNRTRYVCWPMQWLRFNFTGVFEPDTQQEMELSEPLMC